MRQNTIGPWNNDVSVVNASILKIKGGISACISLNAYKYAKVIIRDGNSERFCLLEISWIMVHLFANMQREPKSICNQIKKKKLNLRTTRAMQMFIDNRLIFKGNSNSGIKRATKTISSIQANIENGKPIAMEGSN